MPHAIAELIYNSIQATKDNKGPRTVDIDFQLGGRGA
ncbi:unnamed protein product, partial [Ectocarpus sp. 12 AP-2014]